MVIISKTILNDFGNEHPDVIDALNDWYRIVKDADWNTFHDIKQTFNSVDSVGNDRYVFDIKGNHYRIVAMIFFDIRTVFIRFVGTHKEYDKINCSKI
jgi:mRNA interferase HigB